MIVVIMGMCTSYRFPHHKAIRILRVARRIRRGRRQCDICLTLNPIRKAGDASDAGSDKRGVNDPAHAIGNVLLVKLSHLRGHSGPSGVVQ